MANHHHIAFTQQYFHPYINILSNSFSKSWALFLSSSLTHTLSPIQLRDHVLPLAMTKGISAMYQIKYWKREYSDVSAMYQNKYWKTELRCRLGASWFLTSFRHMHETLSKRRYTSIDTSWCLAPLRRMNRMMSCFIFGVETSCNTLIPVSRFDHWMMSCMRCSIEKLRKNSITISRFDIQHSIMPWHPCHTSRHDVRSCLQILVALQDLHAQLCFHVISWCAQLKDWWCCETLLAPQTFPTNPAILHGSTKNVRSLNIEQFRWSKSKSW